MVDATRALLDELMGRERNVPLTERTNRELTFSSPEVCKYAIAGLCPYGLFRNTKSDLGAPQGRAQLRRPVHQPGAGPRNRNTAAWGAP